MRGGFDCCCCVRGGIADAVGGGVDAACGYRVTLGLMLRGLVLLMMCSCCVVTAVGTVAGISRC